MTALRFVHSAHRVCMPRDVMTPALARRTLITTIVRRSDSDNPFQRAGPPPLPKEEQLEFERLVRENQSTLLC